MTSTSAWMGFRAESKEALENLQLEDSDREDAIGAADENRERRRSGGPHQELERGENGKDAILHSLRILDFELVGGIQDHPEADDFRNRGGRIAESGGSGRNARRWP